MADGSISPQLAACTVLAVLLLIQIYLIWTKSFNWDEALHFGQVYKLRNGTLPQTFQVLHSRILYYIPDLADDLITQFRLARLFMWVFSLVTLIAIYGVVKQFLSTTDALFAVIAYLTAGYVFVHTFSIRADPMAAATLMIALFLFASADGKFWKFVTAGALVGLAGMMTLKSVFYAPCFVGLAWLNYARSGSARRVLAQVAVALLACTIVFVAVLLLHQNGLAEVPEQNAQTSSLGETAARWFVDRDLPALRYVWKQALFAAVFVICVALSPIGWRENEFSKSEKMSMIGFAVPLLVLLVYRNTFPYFFVFLLAPAAVAAAPGLTFLRQRYGSFVVLVLLLISPAVLVFFQSPAVMQRQQAMIEYIHEEIPEPAGYLATTDIIADYPRALPVLASGVGITNYYERGDPEIANRIKAGEIAFVLADHLTILAAVHGDRVPNSFLPDDVSMLSDNFVNFWGPLFLPGKVVPPGNSPVVIEVPAPAPYTLAGGLLTLDGQSLEHGDTIFLERGRHRITSPRADRTVLWRGEDLPTPPPFEWKGQFYTDF